MACQVLLRLDQAQIEACIGQDRIACTRLISLSLQIALLGLGEFDNSTLLLQIAGLGEFDNLHSIRMLREVKCLRHLKALSTPTDLISRRREV